MKKTLAATLCIALLALAAPAGSAGILSAEDVDALPRHLPGNEIGCNDPSSWAWGYGMPGVPSGPCATPLSYTFDLTHSYVECAQWCYAAAWGYDPATGAWGEQTIWCNNGGSILVDWNLGQHVHLSGDCAPYTYGAPLSALTWQSYFGAESGIKFVHADNLAATLLH